MCCECVCVSVLYKCMCMHTIMLFIASRLVLSIRRRSIHYCKFIQPQTTLWSRHRLEGCVWQCMRVRNLLVYRSVSNGYLSITLWLKNYKLLKFHQCGLMEVNILLTIHTGPLNEWTGQQRRQTWPCIWEPIALTYVLYLCLMVYSWMSMYILPLIPMMDAKVEYQFIVLFICWYSHSCDYW